MQFNCPIPHAAEYFQILKVYPSPRCPSTFCCTIAGRLAPDCVCGRLCLNQRRDLLLRPCFIDTQSGQCVKATWPWPIWGSLQIPSIPQTPAQRSLCSDRSPWWCWPHKTIVPETLQPLHWSGGSVPELIVPGPAWHYSLRSLDRPRLEGWGGVTALC